MQSWSCVFEDSMKGLLKWSAMWLLVVSIPTLSASEKHRSEGPGELEADPIPTLASPMLTVYRDDPWSLLAPKTSTNPSHNSGQESSTSADKILATKRELSPMGIAAEDGETSLFTSQELEKERAEEASFLQQRFKPRVEESHANFTSTPELDVGDSLPGLDDIDLEGFDIPVVINRQVVRWMEFFLTRGRPFYQVWLARSTRYSPMIEDVLEAQGLPRDLLYCAMIESGFSPVARSSMGAVGMWQMMRPTGTYYGLEVSRWVDERRDPEKATRAAVAHLSDLHDRFGDWYLALAAYNAGPTRVIRAMNRLGSDDYWILASSPYLLPETQNYIPRLLAAAIIAKNPDRFGINDVTYDEVLLYDRAEVIGSTNLEEIADRIGVELEELVELNPELKSHRTPPRSHQVKLPLGTLALFEANYVSYGKRGDLRRHVVQAGDTLLGLAHRFGVAVQDLMDLNKMTSTFLRVGKTLLVPHSGMPLSPYALEFDNNQIWQQSSSDEVASLEAHSDEDDKSIHRHRVRSGETLSQIAHRYGVTVDQVQSWNRLTDVHQIRAGSELILRTPLRASEPRSSARESNRGTAPAMIYRVKKGDSLWKIATHYEVSLSQLIGWNDLRGDAVLRVGQPIAIRLK